MDIKYDITTDVDDYLMQEHIKTIFENISDDEIKNLITYSVNIDKENINIKEVVKDYYYINNKSRSYITEDDIYTNGLVLDTEYGKLIKNFTLAFVIHRNRNSFTTKSIDVIFGGHDPEILAKTKRDLLPIYLAPVNIGLFI